MRTARFAAPLFLMAAFIAGTAFADNKSETRAVEAFNGVGVSAPITVYLTQGDSQSLVLEGDEAALAQLETYVENGSLKLRQKTHEHVHLMGKVKAYVTAKEIRAIAIAGSGDVIARSLRTGDVKLAISGSGDIHIESLTAAKVHAAIGGSGDIVIAGGKAESIDGSVAGSGDLRAGNLEVADAKVAVAGSGDIVLWAKNSITASIVGSGDVRYYGEPAVRKTSVIGSGSFKNMGAAPS